jgi:hypothetical protein
MANRSRTLYASAARTTAQTGSPINNPYGRGLRVHTNVTADPAAASITVTVQGYDATAGDWYDLLASAAINAVGKRTLLIYPGATTAANLVANLPAPPVFRVNVAVADADSMTYSIGCEILE